MSNQITGFFISFNDREMVDISRRLELFGYSADGEGLKKLVIQALCDMEAEGEVEETPTDRVIGKMKDYLDKNPDKVLMGMAALQGLSKLIGKKKS